MSKNKLVAFVAGAALIAVFTACETATNTNTNANGNTAVVMNTNANAHATANANVNANANANKRGANANITREEYEKEKTSFAEEAKRLGRTVGSGVNDGWLWTKTRALLAVEDDLRDSTINVDVDNAVVTLSGTVPNPAQKAKAERVARGVDGVKSVKNNLTVSANGNANSNSGASRNSTKP